MIDFELWIQIGIFHFTLTPKSIALIRIKNGIFHYWINWHKPEPKANQKPVIDDDSTPIPF